MKISTLFKACIFIILMLFALIFYSGRELILSKEVHATALERKEKLEAAGRKLAKGSDYLSNEIRRYTQFGDEKHFKNFWKEVNETKSREVIDELERLGALPSEIRFLKKSKNFSDNLIEVERQAMEAVEKGELEKARKLVFGDFYDHQKDLIMGNISSFQKAVAKRINEEVEQAKDKTTFYLSLSILLVGISGLFVLFGFYVLGLKKLVLPLSRISEIFSESIKSDSIKKIPCENNKDEIGILSSAFNQLINKREALENELKFSNKNLEKVVNKQTAQLNLEKEEVEDEKARLSTIMENLIDGLIIIDSQGIIKSINPAVTELFGYTSPELVGQNVKMIMPEPYHSEHDQFLKNYMTTGKAKIIGLGREVVGLRKDGSTFDLDLGVTQLDTHEGTSFIGTLRDITERKRAEQEINSARDEAEKANRAKSLFLANMSHEIRTPMNAVLGYSQILLRNKNLDRETLDSIRTIDNSGKNLLKMINEILDISKIEAGKMELNLSNFDLNVLLDNIDSMFELRCRQRQLKWTIDAPPGPVIVRADEVKLRQILINLLGNAVKFTDSGKVTLSIKALENDQFRFDVTDTGNGIPAEEQNKIFEAFQQEEQGAKKGGTGLGLAISKKQLELMGSDLHLESKVNEGSNFYFTLTLPPVDEEHYSERRGKHRNVLHLKPESKVKALVVDDIKENRDVLAKLLLSIGAEVLEGVNGKEGVEKTIEYEPDIVFMDMRMPVMRGEDAIKLIVEKFGKDRIKLVTITASALDKPREFFLDLGCHEFISKPFTAEQIYNCLEELLDVEYVYDEDENSQEKPSSIEEPDLSKLSIPQDLYEKMKESAEQYNITYLEKALEELHQRDKGSGQLYEYILKLSKVYDMEAIINVLENISKTND